MGWTTSTVVSKQIAEDRRPDPSLTARSGEFGFKFSRKAQPHTTARGRPRGHPARKSPPEEKMNVVGRRFQKQPVDAADKFIF